MGVRTNAPSASRHTTGAQGATHTWSDTIGNNSTWRRDIYFYEEGSPMDLSALDFKLTVRLDPAQDNADLTVSTDDDLSIQDDTSGNHSILRIDVDASRITGLTGDYVADLASKDVSNIVTLHAHGVFTFFKNPVSWP